MENYLSSRLNILHLICIGKTHSLHSVGSLMDGLKLGEIPSPHAVHTLLLMVPLKLIDEALRMRWIYSVIFEQSIDGWVNWRLFATKETVDIWLGRRVVPLWSPLLAFCTSQQELEFGDYKRDSHVLASNIERTFPPSPIEWYASIELSLFSTEDWHCRMQNQLIYCCDSASSVIRWAEMVSCDDFIYLSDVLKTFND